VSQGLRPITGHVLLVAAALAVGGLLVEVLLRVLALPNGDAHFALTTTFRLDPDLIYTLEPGSEATWSTDEFTEHRRINTLGMRDDEPPAKRPGEIRMLAVGDSFTYGHGVQMHESWPKVVQARLRAANLDVTVLNAGVPGWSPDQSYRYAQRVVGPLAVDIVLFGLNSNDLHDVIDAPLFDVRDGHLIPLRGERTWIHLQGRLAAALPSPLARMRTVRLLLASLRGADLYGQRPALDPEALQEWARTKIRTEVLTLHQSLRRDDVALVVVITPRGGSLDSLVGDFERASLPVLRVTPPADGEARYYFPRDGHLTPAGNDFVGRRVATWLVEHEPLSPRQGPSSRRSPSVDSALARSSMK
jgi:lysophospholipase L1-like esterase